jgi:hypothetical protein
MENVVENRLEQAVSQLKNAEAVFSPLNPSV